MSKRNFVPNENKEARTIGTAAKKWKKIYTDELHVESTLDDGTNITTVGTIKGHLDSTNNPHSVSKEQIGLGNADNTSDVNKPVSTAQQSALDLKVDKVSGKQLSQEDYTTAEKNKLSNLDAGDKLTVSAAEKSTWNGKQNSLGYTPVPNTRTVVGKALSSDITLSKSDVGLANADNTADADKPISSAAATALGLKADLVAGKVPASQLPAYVDDVLEYANIAAFPVTGESGKIYVALDTNVVYRYSGTAYVEISSSLALGETSGTAYRGDRGKIAYDHSQTTHDKTFVGLANVNNTSDANKPVSTAQQTALDLKVDKVAGKGLTKNELTDTLKTNYDTAYTNSPTTEQKYALAGTSGIPGADNRYVTEKDPRFSAYNDIKVGNVDGAGVSICPNEVLPAIMKPISGTYEKSNANYGNYKCNIDNSIMVYIAAFVYKLDNEGDPIIKAFKEYDYNLDAAIADGFILHREFINNNKFLYGIFVDKYEPSLTNVTWAGTTQLTGVASSIKNGNPIGSDPAMKRTSTNGYCGAFSNCISNGQFPQDAYYGSLAVAKSRGNDFVTASIFTWSAIDILVAAHAKAVSSATYCAWYDSGGIKNFPRGNNNYGSDYNDATTTWQACDDNYWNAKNEVRKTGSANNLAMTTHNGQLCGIADVQGNSWKIAPGITCLAATKSITAITRASEAVFTVNGHGYANGDILFIEGTDTSEWNSLLQYLFTTVETIDINTFKLKRRTNGVDNDTYISTAALSLDYDGSGLSATKGTFYIEKESHNYSSFTSGASISTDHWGAAGCSANFDVIDLSDILINKYTSDRFGNGSNIVRPFSTDRASNSYKLAACKMPKDRNALSSAGTNKFGTDLLYKWLRDLLCALVGGSFDKTSDSGVSVVNLSTIRTNSSRTVSVRLRLLVSM